MFRALVLGAVQGLTEFIPISSSGHLVLVPFVLNWNGVGGAFDPGVPFDVAVHLGTALAVVVYFRRELWGLLTGSIRRIRGSVDPADRRASRTAGLLALGSIPAAVAGFAFERFFEGLFGEPQIVSVMLLVTAALLIAGDRLHDRRETHRDEGSLTPGDALLIGAFQALAIAPGISRSGATIVAGLGRGLSREAAARFSFLLGLPAIAGAGVSQLPDFAPGTDWGRVLGAAAVAAGVGFGAIAYLLRHLRSRSLRPFAIYCALAAAVGLGTWFQIR